MRDSRLEKLVANLLDYSLEIKPGEKMFITGEGAAVPLITALIEAAYRRGAVPCARTVDERVHRAWLLGATREQMDLQVCWEMQRVKDIDASVYISAGENASELADVPGSTLWIHLWS